MTKWRLVSQSDGTRKAERIPDTPEELKARKDAEERKRIHNRERHNKYIKEAGFERDIDYRNYLAKEKGFKNYSEYVDNLAVKRGFENHAEEVKIRRHINGINIPMDLNKDCSAYLGICIAENLTSELFKNAETMPMGNKGFDKLCTKGCKLDVKSSTIRTDKGVYESWKFIIKENKIADYFLLIAFDNRKSLKVLHMWFINGNEVINNKFSKSRKLNEFYTFTLVNTSNALYRYKKYELSQDKLDKANEICEDFKNRMKGKI